MKIKWNEQTWYSRFMALIFFVTVLPPLAFYIGMEYQETIDILTQSAEYVAE